MRSHVFKVLSAALLLIAARPSMAAIALGATTSVTAAYTGTPISTSAITTAASGSTFVIIGYGPSGGSFTPSDSKGNRYVSAGPAINDTSNGIGFQMFYAVNATGGSGFTASLALNSHATITLAFVEITGVATSSVLDKYTSSTLAGSPISVPLTTTQPAEIILSYAYNGPGATLSCGTGFTIVPNVASACYEITSATGTYNADPTWSGGGLGDALAASFSATPVPQTGHPNQMMMASLIDTAVERPRLLMPNHRHVLMSGGRPVIR